MRLSASAVCVYALARLLGAQDSIPVFKADAQLVVLQASVIDRSGKPLTNVPQSAFKVLEDNVEQRVRTFRREDVPVSLGLIIDKSGSMRKNQDRVAAAALTFIKTSNPDDEVFVVHFNDDTDFDQTFTSDVGKLERALHHLEPWGNTAMRDAISRSIDYAKQHGQRDKKVLLVVTDGSDTTSREKFEYVVRKARQSEVLIYCIGLFDRQDRRGLVAAKRELRALSEASGGRDYYPKDLAEVEKITLEVAREIRSQYTLAYSPSNPTLDGTFRRIRVSVAGFDHAVVRTRSGYYANPTPAPKNGGVPRE